MNGMDAKGYRGPGYHLAASSSVLNLRHKSLTLSLDLPSPLPAAFPPPLQNKHAFFDGLNSVFFIFFFFALFYLNVCVCMAVYISLCFSLFIRLFSCMSFNLSACHQSVCIQLLFCLSAGQSNTILYNNMPFSPSICPHHKYFFHFSPRFSHHINFSPT